MYHMASHGIVKIKSEISTSADIVMKKQKRKLDISPFFLYDVTSGYACHLALHGIILMEHRAGNPLLT